MPTSSSSASTRANSRARRSSAPRPPSPCTHAICAYFSRRDVGRVAGRRHELARQRGVVAQDVREEDPVGAAVRDAEARADRVGERVADADERVGERQPGERRRVAHRRARGEVRSVGAGARERVEDQVQRLHAERVGVGRGEDRDAGLERVRERVDAGVGGQRRRHRERQARVDDRHVGHERVVDERELAPARGEHRGRRDLRAGARRGRHGHEPERVLDLGDTAPRACARRGTAASARQRQLAGSRGTGGSPSRRRARSRRRRR